MAVHSMNARRRVHKMGMGSAMNGVHISACVVGGEIRIHVTCYFSFDTEQELSGLYLCFLVVVHLSWVCLFCEQHTITYTPTATTSTAASVLFNSTPPRTPTKLTNEMR